MLRGKFSLRRQLLVWLLIPQVILWVTGAILCYNVATHYATRVLDDSLQETGRALARQVREEGGQLELGLRHSSALMLDRSEQKLYYSVSAIPGGLIAGNHPLSPPPPPPTLAEARTYFGDVTGQQGALRVASMYFPLPDSEGASLRWLLVQVAKGLQAHNRLSHEILVATALPLGLLILVMSICVHWGIVRGLKPLTGLKSLMEHRDPQDLAPLELGNAPEEVHALTHALNHLLSTTNENIARQRRFIADAAHQLRTPLAGLKSQTELAMRETTPEGLRDRLNMVHASATRSIHLVNQLLTLARSEPANQTGMPQVRVDLAKLVRELTAEAVPRALAAGMDLGCDSPLLEAPIHGNSALLRELFVNLVENAIKYIPRGGNITVRLNREGALYVVEVEDDGPGIPDEQKPRIFERFYRVNQNDGNGCGLGMAIVKEIAERHHGSVALNDAKPHGLIVRVTLPASEDDPALKAEDA
ncbi:two-component system sensor kinase [Chitiniphilus shinanonensis]|uniref:histidine kinase n=1 Tax=Chitiniphilus shinanonensis TaxID=553088 RepID=A0ABQ6BSF1_9NEIS|nr:sensor histidine kinase [Chitiniphilus shinanonensis]GLS03157.1 two-component system sensor kinase [Chitiniphilus shinanonensis]